MNLFELKYAIEENEKDIAGLYKYKAKTEKLIEYLWGKNGNNLGNLYDIMESINALKRLSKDKRLKSVEVNLYTHSGDGSGKEDYIPLSLSSFLEHKARVSKPDADSLIAGLKNESFYRHGLMEYYKDELKRINETIQLQEGWITELKRRYSETIYGPERSKRFEEIKEESQKQRDEITKRGYLPNKIYDEAMKQYAADLIWGGMKQDDVVYKTQEAFPDVEINHESFLKRVRDFMKKGQPSQK